MKRDDQQWVLDWLVKTTGRVQNFANDERDLPPEVKSYRMIPRVLYKEAPPVIQARKPGIPRVPAQHLRGQLTYSLVSTINTFKNP